MSSPREAKQRICIVGGGVAGMACAWSLSRFPDRFDVELWEKASVPGGAATSCSVTTHDGQTFAINDQVQGGAPSYRNNLLFFETFGFHPSKVDFKVRFGTDDQGNVWSNHGASTPLVKRLESEIERFGRVLKWVARLEVLFVFIPIATLLKMLRFSDEFRNEMVFPLVALFFGTGNQTPSVSSAVIARVFLDPELRIFEYSSTRLLASCPEMFAFPHLETIFTTMSSKMQAKVVTNRGVTRVQRHASPEAVQEHGGSVTITGTDGTVQSFDQVVFACDAETILKVLDEPRWMERRTLGKIQYFDDYIVTHDDEAYMASHYSMLKEAEDMYFVRTNPLDKEKIEMSFNLSHYQPHLQDAVGGGKKNIYQSIFLNKRDKDSWTVDAIDPTRILKTRWTRVFSHTWRHFAFWVPFVRFLQGRRNTWYIGAVTLFGTHEIATMSGLAVADRLGAKYPFAHDALARKQFETYLKIAHGVKWKEEKIDKGSAYQAV